MANRIDIHGQAVGTSRVYNKSRFPVMEMFAARRKIVTEDDASDAGEPLTLRSVCEATNADGTEKEAGEIEAPDVVVPEEIGVQVNPENERNLEKLFSVTQIPQPLQSLLAVMRARARVRSSLRMAMTRKQVFRESF